MAEEATPSLVGRTAELRALLGQLDGVSEPGSPRVPALGAAPT